MGGKKRRQYRRLQDDDISSDDLAIIGAGFTVLGDFFDLLSLMKLKEEKAQIGNGTSEGEIEETLIDQFMLLRSKPENKKRRKK